MLRLLKLGIMFGRELKALDLLEKPGARESPIILYGGKRNLENLSDFLIRATAEITQLHGADVLPLHKTARASSFCPSCQ